jgi:hypothetical protein
MCDVTVASFVAKLETRSLFRNSNCGAKSAWIARQVWYVKRKHLKTPNLRELSAEGVENASAHSSQRREPGPASIARVVLEAIWLCWP